MTLEKIIKVHPENQRILLKLFQTQERHFKAHHKLMNEQLTVHAKQCYPF